MKRNRRNPTRQAINNRHRSSRPAKNKFADPKTLEEFLARPARDQDLWNDVGQIVTEVRKGSSLSQASRKFGRDARTIQRLARPALRKMRNGRWAAKKYDQLLRVLSLPSRQGLIEVGVTDSRQATIVGEYWNAVDLYRDTGDASALQEFLGKHIINADGERAPLLTDLHELDRLGSAGVLSFESLYARAA